MAVKMHLRCRFVPDTEKFEFRWMTEDELNAVMGTADADKRAALYEQHGKIVAEIEPEKMTEALGEWRKKLGEMKSDGKVSMGVGELDVTLGKPQFAQLLEYLETVHESWKAWEKNLGQ